MSFLANMPSRNAMNFSLMLPGEAGARRPSPSQTKVGVFIRYNTTTSLEPPVQSIRCGVIAYRALIYRFLLEVDIRGQRHVGPATCLSHFTRLA
ncbi:unnamed protein product [Ectocarpus sp. 12 AP-2014]